MAALTLSDLKGVGEYGIGPHSRKEEKEIINEIAASLPGAVADFADVSFAPNARTIDQVMAIINGDKECPAVEAPFGTQVGHGAIGIIRRSGELTCVGRGTYILPNPRAEFVQIVQLDNLDHVQIDELTILRVPKEDYALCNFRNRSVIVTAGSGNGYVVMNDGFFQFERTVSVNTPHIQHGILHILRVNKGMYAKVVSDGLPALLPPGKHIYESDMFDFEGYEDIAHTDCIQHRTITRLDVRAEMYALVWVDNLPRVIKEHGVYLVDSVAFKFDKFIGMNRRAIVHGSLLILNVVEDAWAVVRENDVLKVLDSGTYEFHDPGVRFVGLFNRQQKCLDLGGRGANRAQTQEFVEVDITAVCFYFVRDPIKMLKTVGDYDKLEQFLDGYCSSALANQVRKSSVLELGDKGVKKSGRRKAAHAAAAAADVSASFEPIAAVADGTPPEREPAHVSAPPAAVDISDDDEDADLELAFLDRICKRVHRDLHGFILREYGVELDLLRINDITVIDAALRRLLSSQSVELAGIEAEMKNLASEKRMQLSRAETRAQGEKKQIEADSDSIRKRAESAAHAMVRAAQAKAHATKVETEAYTSGMLLIAEAEAERLRLMAFADAQRVELVGKTPFGREFAIARMQADAFRDAMSGTSQIVNLTGGSKDDPRGMVFNPGDAPPCAGTWHGEELKYVSTREAFMQALDEEQRAKLAAGGTATMRSSSTVTIISVPDEDTVANAFCEMLGQRPSGRSSLDAAQFSRLVAKLFPSWAKDRQSAPLDAFFRSHFESRRRAHISWPALQNSLWFVCHYGNIVALLARFDAVQADAGSSSKKGGNTDRVTGERLISIDDIKAANTLLGIREDLKALYTMLDGHSRGGIPLSELASWMAGANRSQIDAYQKPFNGRRFGASAADVESSRVVSAAATDKRGDRPGSSGANRPTSAGRPTSARTGGNTTTANDRRASNWWESDHRGASHAAAAAAADDDDDDDDSDSSSSTPSDSSSSDGAATAVPYGNRSRVRNTYAR